VLDLVVRRLRVDLKLAVVVDGRQFGAERCHHLIVGFVRMLVRDLAEGTDGEIAAVGGSVVVRRHVEVGVDGEGAERLQIRVAPFERDLAVRITKEVLEERKRVWLAIGQQQLGGVDRLVPAGGVVLPVRVDLRVGHDVQESIGEGVRTTEAFLDQGRVRIPTGPLQGVGRIGGDDERGMGNEED
jgi:hypothetical protein